MNWYLEVFKKYAVLNGRARRKEYWIFFLVNWIIMLVLRLILPATKTDVAASVIILLYSLAVIMPALGVCVRRLHDTGKSGWFMLLGLIPLAGDIVLLVFFCQDSQLGVNKYGAYPKNLSSKI